MVDIFPPNYHFPVISPERERSKKSLLHIHWGPPQEGEGNWQS